MTVRIDLDARKISLGVKDLAYSNSAGNIYPDMALPVRAAIGRGAHTLEQKSRHESEKTYQSEVHLKHETEVLGFHVTVQGRIDGVYEENGCLVVEEIKSVFNIHSARNALQNGEHESSLLQVDYYIWLLGKQTAKPVKGYLVFIGISDGVIERVKAGFEEDAVQEHFRKRIEMLINEERLRKKWQEKQKNNAQRLEFPFPVKRRYQQEMMDEVESVLLKGTDIMISAPTGVGKTVAAIFPALRYSLCEGMRVFFATSKTTQQRIVIDTLEMISRRSGAINAIHIRAKEKTCINSIYFCHPDFCRYARNYQRKLMATPAVEELLHKRIIRPEDVNKAGHAHVMCPFELSLDVAMRCNVIVCDYNYIFDPAVYFKRFFLDKYDDSILIIDEAHSLYKRGIDYYSPVIDRGAVRGLMRSCSNTGVESLQQFSETLEKLDDYMGELDKFGNEEYGKAPEYIINPDMELLNELHEQMQLIAAKYYIHKQLESKPVREDPVQKFFYDFEHFNYVLSLGGDEFAFIYNRGGLSHTLKILCCDPSRLLGKRIAGFRSTIAMSATLQPKQFYRDVLGFDRDTTALKSFPSPFPAENRKILILPMISTKYAVRHKFYRQIAELIADIAETHHGNYLVFFPSFDFLDEVYAWMPSRKVEIICQRRTMTDGERDAVIERLKGNKGAIIFAVQSGVFAEGVDYPGEMVVGAIIIGPGLPQFNYEQELMRNYYDLRFGLGFEYAYLYPGMNRVIQAAGRVIRSETDRGIIVLVCQRFATKYYNSLLPEDWYEESPSELVTKEPLKALKDFWDSFEDNALPE